MDGGEGVTVSHSHTHWWTLPDKQVTESSQARPRDVQTDCKALVVGIVCAHKALVRSVRQAIDRESGSVGTRQKEGNGMEARGERESERD